MAKDPAFLFYASDFLTGTMFFSDAQVGKYIRLLCCQHQHGGLIEKNTFENIVGTDNILRSKFIESEHGYYNVRLSTEMELRHKKSENISKAAKETWEKRKKDAIVIQSYNERTTIPIRPEDEDESEDINESKEENKIKRKVFEIPELSEFLEVGKFCCQKAKVDFEPLAYSIELKYHAWKSDGWKDGHGKQIKNWKTKLGNTLPYLKKMEVKKDTWVG